MALLALKRMCSGPGGTRTHADEYGRRRRAVHHEIHRRRHSSHCAFAPASTHRYLADVLKEPDHKVADLKRTLVKKGRQQVALALRNTLRAVRSVGAQVCNCARDVVHRGNLAAGALLY